MTASPDFERNGSANGGWRKWQIYATMTMVLVTMGTIVFRAGFAGAMDEAKIQQLEGEVAAMRADFVRKDVLDERLTALEATQTRIEKAEERQGQVVDEVMLQLKKGR